MNPPNKSTSSPASSGFFPCPSIRLHLQRPRPILKLSDCILVGEICTLPLNADRAPPSPGPEGCLPIRVSSSEICQWPSHIGTLNTCHAQPQGLCRPWIARKASLKPKVSRSFFLPSIDLLPSTLPIILHHAHPRTMLGSARRQDYSTPRKYEHHMTDMGNMQTHHIKIRLHYPLGRARHRGQVGPLSINAPSQKALSSSLC